MKIFHKRIKQADKRSEAAIQSLLATEATLKTENEEIDNVIERIDGQLLSLHTMRQTAETRKKENNKIVDSIGQMVRDY